MDFYRGFFARLPDTLGLGYWLGRFRAAQCQGPAFLYAEVEAISKSFANLPEYQSRNRSAADFLGDMYNGFMRRGADVDGFNFWATEVSSGRRSRDDVCREFMASHERLASVAADSYPPG